MKKLVLVLLALSISGCASIRAKSGVYVPYDGCCESEPPDTCTNIEKGGSCSMKQTYAPHQICGMWDCTPMQSVAR